MHGIDCVFCLRKSPNRVQDCRVLVSFTSEWDCPCDAMLDAAAVCIAHASRAVVDGWQLSDMHFRHIGESHMEEALKQRAHAYATEWYGVPCRVIEGQKTFWMEGCCDG
jgi:hypothetical protein